MIKSLDDLLEKLKLETHQVDEVAESNRKLMQDTKSNLTNRIYDLYFLQDSVSYSNWTFPMFPHNDIRLNSDGSFSLLSCETSIEKDILIREFYISKTQKDPNKLSELASSSPSCTDISESSIADEAVPPDKIDDLVMSFLSKLNP